MHMYSNPIPAFLKTQKRIVYKNLYTIAVENEIIH